MTEKAKNGKKIEIESDPEEFSVKDRRHWADDTEDDKPEDDTEPAAPTIIDEFRTRTETAEKKLQEYIEAYKGFREEQEQVRVRLQRDVDRKVALKFGELIGDLLQVVDDLDLALGHVASVPEAAPLADGVALARDRFLVTLEQRGVERVSPDDLEFDPNDSEAIRVDPVDDREKDGKVTETLRPGYKLGDRVIRAAQVAVGRFIANNP